MVSNYINNTVYVVFQIKLVNYNLIFVICKYICERQDSIRMRTAHLPTVSCGIPGTSLELPFPGAWITTPRHTHTPLDTPRSLWTQPHLDIQVLPVNPRARSQYGPSIFVTVHRQNKMEENQPKGRQMSSCEINPCGI